MIRYLLCLRASVDKQTLLQPTKLLVWVGRFDSPLTYALASTTKNFPPSFPSDSPYWFFPWRFSPSITLLSDLIIISFSYRYCTSVPLGSLRPLNPSPSDKHLKLFSDWSEREKERNIYFTASSHTPPRRTYTWDRPVWAANANSSWREPKKALRPATQTNEAYNNTPWQSQKHLARWISFQCSNCTVRIGLWRANVESKCQPARFSSRWRCAATRRSR